MHSGSLCLCCAPDMHACVYMYVILQPLDQAVIIGAVVGGVGAVLLVLVVVMVVVCYFCCCRQKYTERYQQYRCVMTLSQVLLSDLLIVI